jgi:phage-related protein
MEKYTIEYYSDSLQDEILNLPDVIKQRYLRYTDKMEEFGSNLGLPHTAPMGDGLFELRIHGQDGIARVFFCTKVGRKIIMLHCFIKKTQKTPKRELDTARTRMNEVKND